MNQADSNLCDICGKTIAGDKPRTQVTQYLFTESRCQCLLPERAAAIALNNYPKIAYQDKDRGQKLKFVLPQGDVCSIPSSSLPEQTQREIERIQANLPSRYQVSGLFGQGGMGAVFRAFDHEENRAVAIKVIRPQLAHDVDAHRRFEHEARLASTLSHPNIAKVYDFGVGLEDAPYIVMELVEGESLEKLLNTEGPLKSKRALAIGIQIAMALEAAHEKGVLHRDVKPSNIIIIKTENSEIAKITDFGIAKSLLPSSELFQSITQTGLMIGSPMYMSPEQCEGQLFDHRSDIYSLGCVLYKCLCGETPFQSENALKLLLQHIEEQPAPICTRVPDHLSDDLNYIVMSCLDKNPDNRYSSAKDLAADLEHRLAGRKILFHSNEDYSPVHVKYERRPDEDGMPSFQVYKPGGKTVGLPYAPPDSKHALSFYVLSFFMATFLIPIAGVLIYEVSANHRTADRISKLNHLENFQSGHIPPAEIAENRKSLKDVILYFSANAQTDLLKHDYAAAANQFSQLTGIFRELNDGKSEADNLYYVAHCQVALGEFAVAKENFARAIELYKRVNATGVSSLSSRATREAVTLASEK